MEKQVIFILGGPGSGKTTQCELIEKEMGYMQVSMESLLNKERARSGSQHSKTIEKCFKDGRVVPPNITIPLLERALFNSHNYKFVVKGFPENRETWNYWLAHFTGRIDMPYSIYLDCSEEACIDRSLNRSTSNASAHDLELLRRRYLCFITNTLPLVEHLGQLGKIHQIDANKDVVEVFEEIKEDFRKTFPYPAE